MKTELKITILGEGVPGKMLDGVEKALYAYYADSPMTRACMSAGQRPPRVWDLEIDVVPEDGEDDEPLL